MDLLRRSMACHAGLRLSFRVGRLCPIPRRADACASAREPARVARARRTARDRAQPDRTAWPLHRLPRPLEWPQLGPCAQRVPCARSRERTPDAAAV